LPRSNNRCKKLTHEIWNSLDGTKIKKINKKLNFIRNETYLLLCHGSEYQNTPCEWHPPNPVPKGYPTNMEKGLICINLWLNHQSPNPKKGNEEREWQKDESLLSDHVELQWSYCERKGCWFGCLPSGAERKQWWRRGRKAIRDSPKSAFQFLWRPFLQADAKHQSTAKHRLLRTNYNY